MGERQVQLADTIFAMDRAAKEGEIARGGPDAVARSEVVNRIGQAAMVQAHTRFWWSGWRRASEAGRRARRPRPGQPV
jgi:hypothetical protein